MPSQIKREAIAASTGVGKLHATMSRDVMRREIAAERASASVAISDADFYNHTLKAEQKAAKLTVRDGLGVIITPLGAITGTARGRAEYKFQRTEHDDGMDRFFGPASLSAKHIKEHFGDEGVLGAAAYGLTYGSAALVALVTAPTFLVVGPIVCVRATTLTVVGVSYGSSLVCQAAALPTAGLKAAGNGIGNLYGLAVAKRRAKKALKDRQDARAGNVYAEA